MDDVAKIAAGLSEAQKWWLIRAHNAPDGWFVSIDSWTVDDLDDELQEFEAMGITGQNGWIDILTPLGLAVRAHLTGSMDDDV